MSAEQPKTPVTDDVTAEPDNFYTEGTPEKSTAPTVSDGAGTVTPNNAHAEGTKA
ncbi:hypothetical protein [Streptomyces sp. NRRL F-5123]|uniref:hypothetical protein n=1 Tax=Streptomyces sp. NRRL F-5123 TaxID=1463856 RepID=UPI000AB325A8|nr:hypothetical protein [Streptomyces sp. NRRL F-5123]